MTNDPKNKNYKTEWSFSFEKLNDQISDFFQQLGARGEEAINHEQFTAPIESATSARVRLDFAVGENIIRPIDNDNLIEADVIYVGEMKFAVSGETEKVVHLSQAAGAGDWLRSAFGWLGSERRLRWDVGLTQRIPLNLDINCGAGKSDFDLTALNITGLTVNGGAGEVTTKLPTGEYKVSYSAGVGQSNLTIAPNATVDLVVKSGVGEVNLDIGTNADVNARISGGVGEVNIRIPMDAAIRVEAKTGIGSVDVPSRVTRMTAKSEFFDQGGVWQSADYDTAERRITVRFDGGIGALNIR